MISRCTIFLFALLVNFINPQITVAQLFEDFEGASKGAYAERVVNFESGPWLLNDALIGRADGDRYRGSQSVRLRDGYFQMEFDYDEGADRVSFWAANSGFSGDGNGSVQVFYSTDQGNNWIEIEDPITVTDEPNLEFYELDVQIDSPVRLRFEKISGNRVNIDDVTIEPYLDLAEGPNLTIRKGQEHVLPDHQIRFTPVNTGVEIRKELTLINTGNERLEISDIRIEPGIAFSVYNDMPSALESRESARLEIGFQSNNPGMFEETFIVATNTPGQPEFELHLTGRSVDENEVIPVSSARQVPFGTRVTIGGRVTVANEFEGPVFLQDNTGGFAVFYEPFHTEVSRGDSVTVTGPVTEFNPIGGNSGTFLRQIAATENDSDITYSIIEGGEEPEPVVINIGEMNEGNFESTLVTIRNVTFQADGVFQGNQNYTIADATGSGILRMDNSVEELIGATIPLEPTEITGVIDRFSGTYQMKPRDINDLEAEPFEIVGEEISKELTFDVVTWNIEWFGADDLGPDVAIQMENVATVIETIDADLYALQEIANRNRFFELVTRLDEYSGFMSAYSQRQQTAYLFKTAVVDSLDSGVLSQGQDAFNWAGRLPLFFEFDATVSGETRRIRSYNIHAKAFGDEPSYNRRRNAAASMKAYLDEQRRDQNVIFLGDYNDQLNFSTYNEEESPYQIFLDDEHYFAVTKPLEDRGFASFLVGRFRSMIDHIIITNELIEDHINGAQRVENPSYIASYLSTTSDHAPVWTRFDFTRGLLNEENGELPDSFTLEPNYPNPFNSATNLRFNLHEPAGVTITVYDMLGRRVATLADQQRYGPGNHTVPFNAGGLASGAYLYRVLLDSGESETGKMMFIQ